MEWTNGRTVPASSLRGQLLDIGSTKKLRAQVARMVCGRGAWRSAALMQRQRIALARHATRLQVDTSLDWFAAPYGAARPSKVICLLSGRGATFYPKTGWCHLQESCNLEAKQEHESGAGLFFTCLRISECFVTLLSICHDKFLMLLRISSCAEVWKPSPLTLPRLSSTRMSGGKSQVRAVRHNSSVAPVTAVLLLVFSRPGVLHKA